MPKDIFGIYLDKEECERIIAIFEKTGALGSVVSQIRSAYARKGVSLAEESRRLKAILNENYGKAATND